MYRLIKDQFYFFFQAEDGIRDGHVTGVQTCALPISLGDHIPDPHTGKRISAQQRIKEIIELAKLAEQAGVNFFSVGESHQAYLDRKSTRLNSSHVAISYAVFCLKKKKKKQEERARAG